METCLLSSRFQMFLKLTSTFSLPNGFSRSPTASLFPFERTSQLQYGSHMMETLLKLTSNFYLYRAIKKFRKNKDKILVRDLMNRCEGNASESVIEGKGDLQRCQESKKQVLRGMIGASKLQKSSRIQKYKLHLILNPSIPIC